MIRRLYDWTLSLASRRDALIILAIVAFLESSIFPIPPDVMILPMMLAARNKVWVIAGVATISSVLGGFAGYGVGMFLFESLGRPLIEFYGYGENFLDFQGMYQEWGAWIVFGAGVTPFPYKVITIASGVVALDPVVFGIASVMARGLRFYLEAVLLWKFGPPIKQFVEERLGLLTTVFFIVLIGGFVALRWVG